MWYRRSLKTETRDRGSSVRNVRLARIQTGRLLITIHFCACAPFVCLSVCLPTCLFSCVFVWRVLVRAVSSRTPSFVVRFWGGAAPCLMSPRLHSFRRHSECYYVSTVICNSVDECTYCDKWAHVFRRIHCNHFDVDE